jgi:hypothetical protein
LTSGQTNLPSALSAFAKAHGPQVARKWRCKISPVSPGPKAGTNSTTLDIDVLKKPKTGPTGKDNQEQFHHDIGISRP